MTARAVLLGLLLLPLNTFWITVVEVRWYTLDGSCLPLMITPIFFLFVLALANNAWRRWRGGGLDQGELLVVYIMVVVSGVFAAHDTIQNLFGAIGHAAWMATPENRWEEFFFQYLPRWLFVFDKSALTGFYQGYSSVWENGNWRPWVVPLAWWGLFLMVLAAMMLAINLLLRRLWTEHEKLVFPLIQLPLAMTGEESTGFFRNRVMWAGFGVAFAIGTLNGLHVLFPTVPYLAFVKQYNLSPYFPNRPWSAMGRKTLAAYPFAIGLGYFMPSDLLFSCWFFFILRNLWEVLGAVTGWDAARDRGFPYFREMSSGAWLGLAITLVFAARHHWKHVAQAAWAGAAWAENPREGRAYRWAFLTLVTGGVFLMAFSTKAGMTPGFVALFFAIYFLLSLAMTRVRAELGSPHEIYFVNPQQILVTLFGTAALGPANLTVISGMYWLHRCYRSHPMPNQLEAFKMAEGGRVHLGRLVGVLVLASAVSILAAYWANLHVCYTAGAQSKCYGFKQWVGSESFNRLRQWLDTGARPETPNLSAFAGGAAMVFLLRTMRTAFIWWPFHPAGFALAVSFAMDYFWFAFLIAWVVKVSLIRFGGRAAHARAIPFFLGLILGDYTIGSIWAIVGPVLGVATYKVFI
ncbi:MAG: hypothetical protein QHJ73_03215 [Armatimonadota bacterium]|nr:hypothetical protein [Armatimonadota bacterium]